MDLLGWRQHLHVFAIHFMKTYLCILVFFHFNVFFSQNLRGATVQQHFFRARTFSS